MGPADSQAMSQSSGAMGDSSAGGPARHLPMTLLAVALLVPYLQLLWMHWGSNSNHAMASLLALAAASAIGWLQRPTALANPRRVGLALALVALCTLAYALSLTVLTRQTLVGVSATGIVACLCYLRCAAMRRWGLYAGSLLFASLALLTKSVAVMLVPALVLLDWWRGGWQMVRARLRWYIPYLVLGLLYVGTSRRIVDKALLDPVRGLDVQIWTQLKAAVYSLFLTGVPIKLSPHHQFVVSKTPDAVEGASQQEIKTMVWDQLRTCFDPEIPVNIVDLGLVYNCNVADLDDGKRQVEVVMTLTAPGCGMGDVIAGDAKRKLEALPTVGQVSVQVVFEPPWAPEMMSDAAKLQMGML